MDTAKKYAEKLSGFVIPYLLCAVMLSAALNIYTEKVFDINTAAAAVLTAAFFALFEFFRKKKFGGVFYFITLIIVGNIPGIILQRRLFFDFIQWFFSGGQAVTLRTEFAAVFIVLFGFFFASSVFYFTIVVYRSAAVVLVSLIPFALAVKAVAELDWKYPVIIASLNLFMFIYYSRQASLKKAKAAGGSSFMVYADFAVAAALLAAIIPKPAETPFYEQFEKAVNSFQFGGSGVTVLNGDYSEYSGSADDLLRGDSRLLYYVMTNEPVYYKTQVFDIYDPVVRAWKSADDEVTGSKAWQDTAGLLSFEKLSEAIKSAAETSPEIYEEYPSARAYDGIADSEAFSVIYTRDFSAIYVLAPLRIKNAVLSNIGAKYSCRSDNGEVFTNMYRLPQGRDYTVRYYSESTFEKLIEAGACDISFEDYGELLFGAYWVTNFNDKDGSDVAKEFFREYDKAEKYRDSNVTEVSEEIQALADRLTEGLEYDYQKAAAIERYFHKGDFVYSLAYEAPEELDTPEYFIFESKTGTCSDFATAYTLLARAAGLTVRYAEGFTTTQGQDPQPGTYYIYSENAHAYPEVYIPGIGWKIYEPTVPSGLSGGGADDAETRRMTFIITAGIAVVVFAIFILLVIFSPKILEGLFRASLLFCGSEGAVRKLYLRHSERLGTRLDIDPLPMTVEEVSAATVRKTGISLDPIGKPLGEHCYGGKNITKEERKAAYECYKSQYKELTKKQRKKGR